jgi:putative CRISPR-associated protein (TIGR02619 family)
MKVITTVGTSIYNNADYLADSVHTNWQTLNDKSTSYSLMGSRKGTITGIKDAIKSKWLNNPNTSAEIASLIQIQQELELPIEVYLIATETIHSHLCAELIQDWFKKFPQENISVQSTVKVIQGLQVRDKSLFEKKGVVHLIEELNRIAQNGNYWDDCVFNITGGYKAIIPFMTILAQIKKRPLYYIFEEGDNDKYELIEIPKSPLSFDLSFFDDYWDVFEELESQFISKNKLQHDFLSLAESCLDIIDNECCLNGLGNMLWTDYKSNFFIFYCPDDVWNEIQKQNDVMRILSGKFKEYVLSKQKTEKKGDHLVYDDGNNNYRIYYFINDNSIYVYKTFENEEEAKKFISTAFKENERDGMLNNSKKRKIAFNFF